MGLSWGVVGDSWIPRLILETGKQQKRLMIPQILDVSQEDLGFVIHIYRILTWDKYCSYQSFQVLCKNRIAKVHFWVI